MLIGPSVSLRPIEEEDLPLLVTWRNNPRIWARFFNKFPLSFSGQKAWYAELLRNAARRLFMICERETARPVGTIGLDDIDFVNRWAELGNLLIGEQDCLGKGLAREALRLLLDYSFLRLNLNRVQVRIYADNERVIMMHRHCGFRDEGVLRQAQFDGGVYKDVLLMSILSREYAPFQPGSAA